MSQEIRVEELRSKSKRLVDGPLKHVRAAALAAALVPLASICATPASAQTSCASAGVLCGTVFNDTNNNGVEDATETGLDNVDVVICQKCDGSDTITTQTDSNGEYQFFVLPTDAFNVSVLIPTGTQPSPVTSSPGLPSNAGTSGGGGFSSVTNVMAAGGSTDFGFHAGTVAQPGTGTPGYWKNHPQWPVQSIAVGGVTYTVAQAIQVLTNVGKDRTTAMFASLLPAMLNVLEGNDGSCINATIAAGNQWLVAHPLGSNVGGGTSAWAVGDPIHNTLDAYNNGQLCAPHRQ